MISPNAFVDPNAKIGNNVVIYPFAYIEAGTIIGDNCVIYPNVCIMKGAKLGKNNSIHQNTVIGAAPQDFEFKGEDTEVIIGDNNTIRENVVINRGTNPNDFTQIGNGNCIMEGTHISHDTKIANECVIGYGTKIAGNCKIFDRVIFSSNVVQNPDTRVGSCSMIKSGCRFSLDIPPYCVAQHNPIEYGGISGPILTNFGVSKSIQRHIANAYRLVFIGKTSLYDAILQIKQQVPKSVEIDTIIDFLEKTERGVITKPILKG